MWVSEISTDSFGGAHEILKGWTPESHGVFTDDLNRARRQLASGFERNSSKMTPIAPSTDIFGGLSHMKALFESNSNLRASNSQSKTIVIFSDMMNETSVFPMPELIDIGPKSMLERAKASGLVLPLDGCEIHVRGASTSGFTPRAWLTVKEFWVAYFAASGGKLLSYSVDAGTDVR